MGPPIRQRAPSIRAPLRIVAACAYSSDGSRILSASEGQNSARVGPPIRRRAPPLRGSLRSTSAPAPTHLTAPASSPPLATIPSASGIALSGKSSVASRATTTTSPPAPTHRTAPASSRLLTTKRSASGTATSSEELRRFEGHTDSCHRLRLFTGRFPHPLCFRRQNPSRVGPPSSKELRAWRATRRLVTACALLPDGTRILCSDDKASASGTASARAPPLRGPLSDATASATLRRLPRLAASYDETIRGLGSGEWPPLARRAMAARIRGAAFGERASRPRQRW